MTLIGVWGFGGMWDGETPDCLAQGSWVCPCGTVRITDSAQPIVWVRCSRCGTTAEVTGGLPGFECIRCSSPTGLADSFCETCGSEMADDDGPDAA